MPSNFNCVHFAGLKDSFAEGLDHLIPGLGVRGIGLVAQLVGIDNYRAQRGKNTGYFTFTGANASGQANNYHNLTCSGNNSAILSRGIGRVN